ncbi:hypothetical protein BLNAU_25097 [Blattamonas nauphoetae]|uniref:Uncharacterized protein n=1 Tax=Blattamonas nauphoetae TaxID=2049346 RepID=A0ABQ9WKX2_9EUKA|nr:hypothetical protein BLNAU_25097 [Blattamonas nauphoetae]
MDNALEMISNAAEYDFMATSQTASQVSHHRARPPAGPGIHLIRTLVIQPQAHQKARVFSDDQRVDKATVATLLRSQSELCFPSPCSTHPPIAPRGKQDEPERKEEDKKDDSDNSDLIELDPKPKQENTTRPADLTTHPANNVFRCTSEEHRLSPNELDSDAEQQIGVVKQKDGSVDSSLKQELEQLVDTSASSASNADLLRIIDSLKATLVEVERQRSADKAKYEKELRTIGSVSAEEHSELTRLTEENARLTETMSEFQVRAASLATDKTRRKRLTTERDTLKANLTATNQSLDESNQRIDTLSFEVSSLLAQNAELEHLLSKDWLITTDKQTECIGVSESAAQLSSIEKFKPASVTSHQPHYLDDIGDKIGSYMMHFTESDMRKVREYSYALEKGEEVNKTHQNEEGKEAVTRTLSPAKHVPSMTPRKQRSKRNMQPVTEHDVEKQQKEMERRVVEQARKFNKYISSQVGTVASLTAANENTDGQKSVLD